MILLDTNVISEIVAPRGSRSVQEWFDGQHADELFTSSITVAELLAGISVMPVGTRRARLSEEVARLIAGQFDQRVIAFDGECAVEYAHVMSTRRSMGRRIEPLDAQIAAIARLHGAAVATRNVRDFAFTGVDVIDPWSV